MERPGGGLHSWPRSAGCHGGACLRPRGDPVSQGGCLRAKTLSLPEPPPKEILSRGIMSPPPCLQSSHPVAETCKKQCCPGNCHIIARGGSPSFWKARYCHPAHRVSAPASPPPHLALNGLAFGVKCVGVPSCTWLGEHTRGRTSRKAPNRCQMLGFII